MTINKIKGINPLGSNDDGPDVSTFGSFMNSILAHQNNSPQSPPPDNSPHSPPPDNSHHSPPPTHAPTLEFRSIDGSGNYLTTPTTNSAASSFTRIGPAHFFGDDGSTPLNNGINPRMVSNVVVGQGDAEVTNALGLSDWMYAWGQFVDHDLDLMKSGTTPFDIKVPVGDPNFGDKAVIAVNRVEMAQGTGIDGLLVIGN